MQRPAKCSRRRASICAAARSPITKTSPPPGVDHDIVQRARLVAERRSAIAHRDSLAFFGDDGPFPLPATIVDDLLAYLDRVLDCEDANARSIWATLPPRRSTATTRG